MKNQTISTAKPWTMPVLRTLAPGSARVREAANKYPDFAAALGRCHEESREPQSLIVSEGP
jgi:hypothetical protein